MTDILFLIAFTLLCWWLPPYFCELAYRIELANYNARMRRSVPITPGNAWLGLFVESWDGVPPSHSAWRWCGWFMRWSAPFICGGVWWAIGGL